MRADLFIDGVFVSGQGVTEHVLSPSTGVSISETPEASREQVNQAVQAAHRAFTQLVADDTRRAIQDATEAGRSNPG